MADRHLPSTGSFDPITLGHLDVLSRVGGMFDGIVLAIGRNPDKSALRWRNAAVAAACVEELSDGAEIQVETYEGLTVDYARRIGAAR